MVLFQIVKLTFEWKWTYLRDSLVYNIAWTDIYTNRDIPLKKFIKGIVSLSEDLMDSVGLENRKDKVTFGFNLSLGYAEEIWNGLGREKEDPKGSEEAGKRKPSSTPMVLRAILIPLFAFGSRKPRRRQMANRKTRVC